MPRNRLGVFVGLAPETDTRLSAELPPEQAHDIYSAFAADLTLRLATSGYRPTLFLESRASADLARFDPKWPVVSQVEGPLGHRLAVAFEHLLQAPGDRALIISTATPDLPLAYLKRAFQRLKHRDVVLGPDMDGGYYLIGLSRPAASLFANISWGTPDVFAQTLDAIQREQLSLALVAPWYGIDEPRSLRLLSLLERARAMAGGTTLPNSARVLKTHAGD